MIDRIFKNWKTSIVGVILIIVPLVMVFAKVATLTEVGAFIVLGLGAFFSKDPQKKQTIVVYLDKDYKENREFKVPASFTRGQIDQEANRRFGPQGWHYYDII